MQVGPGEIELTVGAQRQADGRQIGLHSGRHGRPVIQLADKRQGGFGVLQYVGHGVGGEVGVERHRDMAGHPDGEVGDDPVGAVFRDQGNVGALGQLTGSQPVGGAAGLVAGFGPSEGLHLPALDGLHQ